MTDTFVSLHKVTGSRYPACNYYQKLMRTPSGDFYLLKSYRMDAPVWARICVLYGEQQAMAVVKDESAGENNTNPFIWMDSQNTQIMKNTWPGVWPGFVDENGEEDGENDEEDDEYDDSYDEETDENQ